MNIFSEIPRIARHYGFRHQAIKTAEEASELAAVMLQYIQGRAGRSAVVEEIADVNIMLMQLTELMQISGCEMEQVMQRKVVRQLGRMKNEQGLDNSEKSSIMNNQQDDMWENERNSHIAWYQELYDKARRAQVDAEKRVYHLEQENAELRRQLGA